METRQEHLDWCKKRALELVNTGDWQGGIASMASDMGKHPETRNHAAIQLGIMLVVTGNIRDAATARDFIEGYN